ncbi:DegT/DnrJ/EryC1/StrS family aminotransferase [Candidatus Bathyarchaeota archaeon]|nr:DegT/DnrJ/EryC1/StrS family aminotransferase [Candidatus Bathyarchaeota archaeon]MBS7628782.1 DegT/DnrJ/EryC1/StrS family aminotransferase [Candidatus Bathyarchaeota archaeon]
MKVVLRINQPNLGEEEVEAATDVLREGILTHKSGAGPRVLQFEREFASYVGARFAVAVNSGTAALHASLLASDVGPGDEVLLPSFTFSATAEAILLAGARPVFVDIDPKTYCMDVENIEEKITGRTKAIIPVHLYGLPADMDLINEVAKRNDLVVIEDGAQAHGAEYQKRKIGSISDMTCFSFYGTKNMTTGEGGMITTNDGEIAERLRAIRSHGEERPYTSSRLGHNYRMPELSAAIGSVQLKKLPTFLERRRKNALYLTKSLENIKGLELPSEPENRKHAWNLYTIRLRGSNAGKRNRIVQKLRSRNIEVTVYYETPIHFMPLYRRFRSHLPETERAARQVLSLPVHPSITLKDLDRIATELKRIILER